MGFLHFYETGVLKLENAEMKNKIRLYEKTKKHILLANYVFIYILAYVTCAATEDCSLWLFITFLWNWRLFFQWNLQNLPYVYTLHYGFTNITSCYGINIIFIWYGDDMLRFPTPLHQILRHSGVPPLSQSTIIEMSSLL